MSTLGWIVVFALAAFVLYALFGKDRFASAIRAWASFGKGKAAGQIDNINVRTQAGIEKAKNAHQSSRRSLYEVDQLIEAAKIEITGKMNELTADKKALEMAAEKKDRPAFDSLVVELNNDQAEYSAMEKSLAGLQVERDSLAGYVDDQAKSAREKERLARELVVSERVANISTMVGEAKAKISTQDTGDSDFEAAQDMLNKKLARANAAKNAAGGLTDDEKAQNQAEAYIKAANSGANAQNSDELWAKMTGATEKPAE